MDDLIFELAWSKLANITDQAKANLLTKIKSDILARWVFTVNKILNHKLTCSSVEEKLDLLPKCEYDQYSAHARVNNKLIPITSAEKEHVDNYLSKSIQYLGITILVPAAACFMLSRKSQNFIRQEWTNVARYKFIMQVMIPTCIPVIQLLYVTPMVGRRHFEKTDNYTGYIWRQLLNESEENFFNFTISEKSKFLLNLYIQT